MAIAKGPDRNAGRERFFRAGAPPLSLDPKDPVLYFLQRLRDEAHRFAIGAHRAEARQGDRPVRRSTRFRASARGASARSCIISARPARSPRAGLADLERVDGISKAVAKKVYDHFHAED